MNKKYGPVIILSFRIYSMLSTQNLQIAEQMRHARFIQQYVCTQSMQNIKNKKKQKKQIQKTTNHPPGNPKPRPFSNEIPKSTT